ncbi:MAG: Mrp/NBP35 family ATP-binding protein [Myxococcota bacterium]
MTESRNRVDRYLLVGAGKGGVGKSTVAVNLALALSRLGAKVGLLDADIHGPSAQIMLGLQDSRPTTQGEMISPVTVHGISCMSMGLLVEPGQAMIWRGPMLATVLKQFLDDVAWGALDYLIVDLPPGTGDVPLSIAQTIEDAVALLVSTPQEVALSDVRKARAMLDKVGVEVIGLVENMSYFVCPHCNKETEVFDRGGAEQAAAEMGLSFLGAIPLLASIRKAGDEGLPSLVAEPDGHVADSFMEMARKVTEAFAARPRPKEKTAKPNLKVIQ